MKKTIIPLILTFFVVLTACGETEVEKDMVQYKSGIYHDKNWNETVGTYQEKIVANKNVAIEIATAVFEGINKSEEVQKYVLQSVFYDEPDEVWIVSFGKDSNEITLGGDCNIAIQKSDGKVLRVWFGE